MGSVDPSTFTILQLPVRFPAQASLLILTLALAIESWKIIRIEF